MGHTSNPEMLVPDRTMTPGKTQKLLYYKITVAKAFNRICYILFTTEVIYLQTTFPI
jgi:hypothetical protein